MSAGFQQDLVVNTDGRGSIDISRRVADVVSASGIQTGMCHVFIQHTSASLMLCENADPDVRADLEMWMSRQVLDGDPEYLHTAEGPDDMSAHIRSVLTSTELNIPVSKAQLRLGTWQGIYLWEHRSQAHERRLVITISDLDG